MIGRAADVAVVGGGPAGAVAATTLARLGLDVVVLEATRFEGERMGETIPPAARPLLARLDPELPERLDRPELSRPSYGTESAWGSDQVESAPFVFQPYGDGMHVDRTKFDAALIDTAERNGVDVVRSVRVTRCEVTSDGGLRLSIGDDTVERVTATAMIDASGRRAGVARSLGADRCMYDRLIGITAVFEDAGEGIGSTLVEATRLGWWYSAMVPNGRLVVTLMTDADICQRNGLARPSGWQSALAATRHTRARVGNGRLHQRPRAGSAATHRLVRRDDGSRWLAAGDAAMAIDPLSGMGIMRALVSGEAAASALAHLLLGQPAPAIAYEEYLDCRFEELWAARLEYYRRETRWPDSDFWARRRRVCDPDAEAKTALASNRR